MNDKGAVIVLKCVLSFVIPCHSSFGLGSACLLQPVQGQLEGVIGAAWAGSPRLATGGGQAVPVDPSLLWLKDT